MMHFFRLLLCSVLIIAASGLFYWSNNQPQDAGPDVPAGKLKSLSFAPFREGFSPLEKIYPLPEHVDEDLRLLADKTQSIRTYSSLSGLQPTPELVRKYGLTMTQGGWLSDELVTAKDNGLLNNKKEMAALIASANANPDVVTRVIVGNEVLLRGELTVERLIEYIREVKRAVKQPVSYADVWSMYMKHPQLINEVDFITIHILPYWEDEPVSVDDAGEHLEKIVRQVENEARGIAPGKPILIGESGWPAEGRQRGMAIPSVVNEAKFIRDMIQVANRHGFDYNIVEAFNQPWKSKLEGVVGANWGLLSANRQAVFPLVGPVMENSDWCLHYAAASALFLLIVVFSARRLSGLPNLRLLVLLSLAQVFSIALVTMVDLLWYTSYSNLQRFYTVVMVVFNLVMMGLLLRRYRNQLDGLPADDWLAGRLCQAYWLFIMLALYKTLGLAFNGRYLSFPVEQFVIPAVGIFGLIACQWLSEGRPTWQGTGFDQLIGAGNCGRKQHWLAYALLIAAVGEVVGETRAFLVGRDFIQAHPGFVNGLPYALSYTLHNQQLVWWLVCLISLSLPFWATRGQSRQH